MTLEQQRDTLEENARKRHAKALEDADRAWIAYLVAKDVVENWPKIEQERKQRV